MNIDAKIFALEIRLRNAPKDAGVARQLVTLLDFHRPDPLMTGNYGNTQNEISGRYREADWSKDIIDTNTAARHYKSWEIR